MRRYTILHAVIRTCHKPEFTHIVDINQGLRCTFFTFYVFSFVVYAKLAPYIYFHALCMKYTVASLQLIPSTFCRRRHTQCNTGSSCNGSYYMLYQSSKLSMLPSVACLLPALCEINKRDMMRNPRIEISCYLK